MSLCTLADRVGLYGVSARRREAVQGGPLNNERNVAGATTQTHPPGLV